ncbi:hypothetical protein F5879DRAFT_923873 [Lentinula edodes]|nr:hypothetical protein F5879DRAFT_923873 [Lentinula edodes]
MTRLNHVRCIPLTLARGINAGSRNRTQVATVVQEMTIGHNQFPRLRIVRRSNDLWFNLRNYAYMDSGHGWRTTGGGNHAIHTSQCYSESLGLAPGKVNLFRRWIEWVLLTGDIQTRYPMDLCLYIRQNLPIFWDRLKHSQLTNPEVFRGVDHDTSGNYPRWGRPTIETNLGRTIYKQKSAGYSDHILYLGANKQCVAAVVEVWGEMVFYGSKFATWTNGKHIIIFARTGHADLTITTHHQNNCHQWEDPDVLATLFGMCCAGIDMKLLGDNGLMNHLVGNTY